MNLLQFAREGFVEIREHAGRTLLQTLGVILGVASVVATMGLTSGQDAARQEYYRGSGGTRLMGVYDRTPSKLSLTASQRSRMGLTLADAEAIRKTIPGFDLVVAEISRSHRVRAGRTEARYRITAIEPEFKRMRKLEMARGRYLGARDMETAAAVAVLGSTRARQLFGTLDPVGRTITIGGVTYTVIGVTKEKVFYFNTASKYNAHGWMNRLITVPVTTYMKRHMPAGTDRIDELNLRLRSLEDHTEARRALEQLLLSRHGVEDFGIWDRRESIEQGDKEGQIYNITFLACGIVSLLVGGIVITNIMLASFTARMRDVGVRKALGATGWQIFVQFLVEALVVTVFGGAIGLAVGIGFTWGISELLKVRILLTPAMVAAAVGSAVVVGLVFGLYPAVRASRLDPVVALRYE